MKRTIALCAALWCSCVFPLLAQAAPPPVEAYARRPALVDVDINPAGTRLAWIDDTGSGTRLIIHDLAARKDLRKLNAPAALTLHALYWANDDTVVLSESSTQSLRRENFEMQRWVAVDAAGGEDRLLLMNGGDRDLVSGASMIRRITSRPNKIFMSTLDFSATNYRQESGTRLAGGRKDSGWISSLYEVDLKSGNGRVMAAGTPFTSDWETDETGEFVVRAEFNPKSGQYDVMLKDGGGWKRIYGATDCGQLSLVGITPEKNAVLASGAVCGDNRRKLHSIPFDGSGARAVAEDPELDVQGPVKDPYNGKVLGVVYNGSRDTLWLDPLGEKRSKGLHKTFPNSSVSLIGRSANGRKVVVKIESSTQAPVYYLVDYDAKSAEIINEEYPKLAGVKLAAVRKFEYTARDKYPLFAWLTVPADSPEKNLPLVVLPHGGPEAHDTDDFDWLTQFIASRGYAVLQPQFRGSSGYGRLHADAGRRQWGLRMQDDVTDAVNAVIEQGIADPKRICIAGWSYGGYAALAGVAFTPELYACAASIAGVSDLPNMLAYVGQYSGKESNSIAYWKDHIGPASDPNVSAKSPARAAAAIKVPVLLLHGTDDTVVPIAQSKLMARALTDAGKPFEFIELPGDDHQLHASLTRVKMATELERFLGQHLGVAPAPAAATN